MSRLTRASLPRAALAVVLLAAAIGASEAAEPAPPAALPASPAPLSPAAPQPAAPAMPPAMPQTMPQAAPQPAQQPAYAGPPLELRPGEPVEITCETKSVVVATGAANATAGALRLALELGDATAPTADRGRWRIVAVDTAHKGSLASIQAETCADGCPLALGSDDVQLWAPAPKGVVELGPDELLMLAVLKTATLQLRVSTFRGQQIEALESGACRIADDVSPPGSAAPAAPSAPPVAPPAASPPLPAKPAE